MGSTKALRIVDCDEGRRLGCETFCCRLIVRYAPDEVVYAADGVTRKACVDKAQDGLCVHLDRDTHRCTIWDRRPSVCRAYSCNDDPLLQVALRIGGQSIVALATASVEVAPEERVSVPEDASREGEPAR